MMVSTPFTTAMTYDSTGISYQMPYLTGTVYSAPYASSEQRAYEMIPHRIFVGGFPSMTTELDLRTFFEQFGHVREAKVIRSNEGASKGYGFITFDTEEEAKAVMQYSNNQDADRLEFKGRRLNLGPAIRRLVRNPRFSPEYALATPSGQLFTTSAIGGLAYGYPQSQLMVIPSSPVQACVYPPIQTALAPPQFAVSSTECREARSPQQQQQLSNNGGIAPVVVVPTTNGLSNTQHEGTPVASNLTPTNSVNGGLPVSAYQTYCVTANGVPQIAPLAQPLTPLTPSNTNQRPSIIPQYAYYAPTATAPNDMTHYSQMTVPTYFLASNALPVNEVGGQPLAFSTPVQHMMITPQTTPQNTYQEESASGHWHNTNEMHPNQIQHCAQKHIQLFSNHVNQTGLQRCDRENSHRLEEGCNSCVCGNGGGCNNEGINH